MPTNEFLQTRAAIQAILVLLSEVKINFDVLFSAANKEQIEGLAKQVATPEYLNESYKVIVSSYNQLMQKIFLAGDSGSVTIDGGDGGFPTTDVFEPTLTVEK